MADVNDLKIGDNLSSINSSVSKPSTNIQTKASYYLRDAVNAKQSQQGSILKHFESFNSN